MKASRIVAPCLAALVLLAAPAALWAQILPTSKPSPSPSPSPTASSSIADQTATGSDPRIEQRIRGIFSQIPSLAHVTVKAQEGVVILGGKVGASSDKAQAEGIANRVSGVVTVQDGIVRDTSLGSGVAGIKKVTDTFGGIAAEFPLILAALLVALVIALVGYLIASFSRIWRRVTGNPFLAELVASAIRFMFILFGIVIGLNMLGAGALLGAVLGGAGVVGLALGFAMKDTIENYVSSLMLSLRQPFRANDKVKIDDYEGRVLRLTTRATILLTPEGNHLRLSNSTVFKAVIVNYTRNPQRRFDFVLQVDTKADPTAARHCGLDALKQLDFVLDQPPPKAVVKDVLYPNIAIEFQGWIDQTKTDLGKARSRAICAVKSALDDNGLAIPDPITKVKMEPDEPGPEQAAPTSADAADDGDVAPEEAVTGMVEDERAETHEKQDLLDARRPTE
ncbi:MAG TPA: mechanosensitive ion channel domain-containing protein [Croceibacterium sp.]|jgi:small-conductance mechanosensitive channel